MSIHQDLMCPSIRISLTSATQNLEPVLNVGLEADDNGS